MVRFIKKGSMAISIATIDNVERFQVMEANNFANGWNLMTLDGKKQIGYFPTLGELETHILEMDK